MPWKQLLLKLFLPGRYYRDLYIAKSAQCSYLELELSYAKKQIEIDKNYINFIEATNKNLFETLKKWFEEEQASAQRS